MPPYWDNKALPAPTLTLPDTLLSTFWLFPSFLLKINAFPMRYEIWKGRKKVRQKAGSNSIASKNTRLTIHATETDMKWVSFFSVDYPNHTLLGGVSVNSFCQQGGLFALSVNRHSENLNQYIKQSMELSSGQ